MTPFLILGLALVAHFSSARAAVVRLGEQRATRGQLDQISAYGFHSAAVAEESADLRASFGDLARRRR